MIFVLNLAVQISPIVPPRWSSFSNKVTWCPSKAATLAASIPPGPAPITTTFCGSSVFSNLNLTSSIAWGLTAHPNFVWWFQIRPIQYSLHLKQGLTSSRWFFINFLGIIGSAINALPNETKSTLPLSINSNALSGLCVPALINGTLTTFLASSHTYDIQDSPKYAGGKI